MILSSKVRIHANFNNTIIDPKDLALFAPGVERIEQPIQLSGVFNGRDRKLQVHQNENRCWEYAPIGINEYGWTTEHQ